jgi:hypothetical protein
MLEKKKAQKCLPHKGKSLKEKQKMSPLSYVLKQPSKCKSPTSIRSMNSQMTMFYDVMLMLLNVPLAFLHAL